MGGPIELSCSSDLWYGCVYRREVVTDADGVCGICGKSHISGTVSVVPRHIELMFEAGIDSISRGGNL